MAVHAISAADDPFDIHLWERLLHAPVLLQRQQGDGPHFARVYRHDAGVRSSMKLVFAAAVLDSRLVL